MVAASEPGKRAARAGAAWSQADLGMLVVALLWGVSMPVVKAGVGFWHPLVFNTLRLVLGALVVPLVALALRMDMRRPAREDWLKFLGLGLLHYTVCQVAFIYGIALTTASNSSLVIAARPALVAILGAALGLEVVARRGWLGVVLCLAGVGMLIFGAGGQVVVGGSSIAGDLLVLVGSAAFALYTLASRRMNQKYGAVRVTIYTMLLGVWPLPFISLPAMLSTPWQAADWPAVWTVLFSGVFVIGLSHVLWNLGIKSLGGLRTTVYGSVPNVLAPLIGWLWLNETMTALQLLGAGLTLVGVVVTRLSSASVPVKESTSESAS
ncbi:MAG: DMT family transporter [Chloroflexi bacterium]|nr:DMT family transporter [Chloroflexota bacterium]